MLQISEKLSRKNEGRRQNQLLIYKTSKFYNVIARPPITAFEGRIARAIYPESLQDG